MAKSLLWLFILLYSIGLLALFHFEQRTVTLQDFMPIWVTVCVIAICDALLRRRRI